MAKNDIILERVNYLLDLGDNTLKSQWTTSDSLFIHYHVNPELHKEFESASLSFIVNLYGEKHPFFTQFQENVKSPNPSCIKNGIGILKSIKTEIEKGWLITLKGLVAAEIFTDFIETSEYLLSQNYKDAAAVIVGSTLEEHLRQLCRKNNIDVEEIKSNGKTVPKKADTLNAELAKNDVYNVLEQKNITAWLDLRNKAAHGKYSEYTKDQVTLMLQGIQNFIIRNQI